MIDILIANTNQIVSEGLKTIVQSNVRNRVVGMANSRSQLTAITSKYHPDIVVIDYSTTEFGQNAIIAIKKIYPRVKILAITNKLPKSTIYSSLRNGVDSYLLTDCEAPEIIEAISETVKGKQFYCGLVIDILAETKDSESGDCLGVSLSKRETEVVRLIADGFSNKQIAEQLFLSTHTVNTHRKNLMSKLGIKNTAGIVIYAVKENIISS